MMPEPFLSLDILYAAADGTPPSLFLSVWKESATCDKGIGEFGTLKSRYALSGLLNTRIVADQRYSIAPVKALFASSSKHVCAVESIISLLYGLARAGSESLAVVCPIPGTGDPHVEETIQRAVELMHGVRAHPMVNMCALHAHRMIAQPWWNVYEDQTIIVHIHWLDLTSLVYLITLRDQITSTNESSATNSVLFIPETADLRMCQVTFEDITAPKITMPIVEDTSGVEVAAKLWCVLVASGPNDTTDRKGWTFVGPTNEGLDQRLLRRGFQQQCRWKRLYPNLCIDGYFPWCSNAETNIQPLRPYTTGTSIVIRRRSDRGSTTIEYRMPEAKGSGCKQEEDYGAEESSVQSFLCYNKASLSKDVNEISLDDSDEDEETLPETGCVLYILGTGCAAPSPHRNASAHVLVLHGQSILFDAGEGTVLQWQRHISDTSIVSVGIIWISHAHWDHFGEAIVGYCHKVSPTDKKATQQMIASFNQQQANVKLRHWSNAVVDHSCLAYGARIEFDTSSSASFSLVFSGDTRPTMNVKKLCQPQVDLLIHEATYEDAEHEMAKAKKHSTRSEALSIGGGLAKRILLTHFSQRYNGVRIETGRDDQTGTMWMTAVDGLKLPLFAA